MRLQKKAKLFALLILIGVAGVSIAYQIAYRPHASMEERQVDFNGSSEELARKISGDAQSMLNKVALVLGEIDQVDETGIVLKKGIYCQLLNPMRRTGLVEGDEVMIKGRFIGYDDLLEEVKLDQCLLLKKETK